MSGPARAGVFIYAKDRARLAAFYESVLGMTAVHTTSELTILRSEDMQLIVHETPQHVPADVTIASPPVKREQVALKFFFTVPSLAEANGRASALGGEVFEEEWRGPGFRVRNACDPEGNIFQLREPAV